MVHRISSTVREEDRRTIRRDRHPEYVSSIPGVEIHSASDNRLDTRVLGKQHSNGLTRRVNQEDIVFAIHGQTHDGAEGRLGVAAVDINTRCSCYIILLAAGIHT